MDGDSATPVVSAETIGNNEYLGPLAFLRSLPPLLRTVMVVVLVFSAARFLVDGVALEMMGRSLSQGGDYGAYYMAGTVLNRGEDLYDIAHMQSMAPELINFTNAPYVYPPLVAIVNMPLALLSFPLAYRVWLLIQLICLFVSIDLVARNLPALGKWAWPFTFILVANMYTAYLALDIGQVNMLVLLVLCLVLHLARRQHDAWVGVVIALGVMIKIVPLLLLGYFLLQKRWRVLPGFIIGMLVLLIPSLLIPGPQAAMGYFSRIIGAEMGSQISIPANVSLAGLAYFTANSLLHSPAALPLLRWGSTLLVLAGLAFITLKKLVPHEAPASLVLVMWIMGIALISPTTWEHNLVWFIPAFGVIADGLVRRGDRISLKTQIAFAACYTLLAFENLPLNRVGQWDFGTGWLFLTGDYLRQTFVAQVRLAGIIGLLGVAVVVLYHHLPETLHGLANLRDWFAEYVPQFSSAQKQSSQS